PDQVVLSGRTEDVELAERRLTEGGLVARRLPVATAFHSAVVESSCAPFRAFLDGVEVAAPSLPVHANAEVAPYPADAEAVRAGLAAQIARPVRFVEQIEAMYEAGVRTFVEVGPNAVLSGLVGRILGDRPHRAVHLDRKGQDGLFALWSVLGRLAV